MKYIYIERTFCRCQLVQSECVCVCVWVQVQQNENIRLHCVVRWEEKLKLTLISIVLYVNGARAKKKKDWHKIVALRWKRRRRRRRN